MLSALILNYRIVTSRRMSRLVTPHVTNWIKFKYVHSRGCQKIKVVQLSWKFVRIHEIPINKILKISAFYHHKQKSFVPKRICGMLVHIRDFKKQHFASARDYVVMFIYIWEDPKILRNLHLTFVSCSASQN